MQRIATNLLSLLLMLPGAAWCDIGTMTMDESAHAVPVAAADAPVAAPAAVMATAAVMPTTLAMSVPIAGGEQSGAAWSGTIPIADRIVVRKSERHLYLMRRGEVLRSYRVALGLQPAGPKERAGDFRTPEGRYLLTRRNARSDYFLSIQVSYPNDQDVRRARHQHVDPGGSIMLHGLPNNLRHPPEYYATADWTDGCIAMSDSDMVELWMMTQDNTPIDIQP
jgi:L,D-transpeptidase catalytic domain